jgi:GNAT superfamily N-acetyltransferase
LLNRFLIRYALQNQQANGSQTYVAVTSDTVVGYYTLAVGDIAHDDAPERLAKGLAHHPVPIMLLARLAVNVSWQGQGIGVGLLKDAMKRTVQVSAIAGVRALTVDAKDDAARSFYEHFQFISLPADPSQLYILLKDLRRIIEPH